MIWNDNLNSVPTCGLLLLLLLRPKHSAFDIEMSKCVFSERKMAAAKCWRNDSSQLVSVAFLNERFATF